MANIPIFLICDDNYSPYMATMIASICSNSKSHFHFYVVGKGISSDNQHKIESMKLDFPNFSIEYKIIDMEKEYNIDYLFIGRMTASTFIRMALPDIFPKVERALIMDVDIISLNDLSSLWTIDLDDKILAASEDYPKDAYLLFKHNFNLSLDCDYVNCGVMIIDCKKWRDNEITQKCFELEKQYRDKLYCSDQDIINYVCLNKIKVIDAKYNSLLGKEPEIINRHFCFLRKPWNSKYDSKGNIINHFEEWWKYAKLTPYYDLLIVQYKKFNQFQEANPEATVKNYKKMELLTMAKNRMKIRKLNG